MFTKTHPLVLVLLCSMCLLSACGGGSVTPPPPPPTPSLAITSGDLPAGSTGDTYGGSGFQLSATGGRAPYHWKWAAASGSSLPAGLNISSDGLISGIPSMPGGYQVVVTAIDAESPSAQVSADYLVNIDGLFPLAINSEAPPSGTVGMNYGPTETEYFHCVWTPVRGWHMVCSQCESKEACSSLPKCTKSISPSPCQQLRQVFTGYTVTATGGAGPYTFSASGLPPDLRLSMSTGQVLGTPTAAGSYNVTFTVKDSQTPPAEADANYVINIMNSGATVSPR